MVKTSLRYIQRVVLKRLIKSKGLLVLLIVLISSITTMLMLNNSVLSSSRSIVTENKNLRYIEVSTVENKIEESIVKKISQIEHVESVMYNFLSAAAVEYNQKGEDIAIIGLSGKNASAIMNKEVDMKEDAIYLNSSYFHDIDIGENISLSFNAKISESSGYRDSIDLVVAGNYDQPILSSWSNKVAIVSESVQKRLIESQYGISTNTLDDLEIGKDSLLVIVDDIDNIQIVANAIEKYVGLIAWYAIRSNTELPLLIQLIKYIVVAFSVILFIMTIFTIYSSAKDKIKLRSMEIAILKTVGYLEQNIVVILIGEYLLLWGLATIVSLITSCLIVLALNQGFIKIGLEFLVEFSFNNFIISSSIVLATMLLTITNSMIKLSRISIIEVFRNE